MSLRSLSIGVLCCLVFATLAACESTSTTRSEPPTDSGFADDEAKAAAPLAPDGGTVAPHEAGSTAFVKLTGFAARGAAFRATRTDASDSGETIIDIALGDADDLCHAARTEKLTDVLHLTLRADGALEPGAFPIVLDSVMGGSGKAPESTGVTWSVSDIGGDKCVLSLANQAATGGTITITAADESALEGTISITLEASGSKIQGSFRATPCFQPPPESVACVLAL